MWKGHEYTLVQLVRDDGACCHTNTYSTGKLLAWPRAMLKLPLGEAAVQQGARQERAGRPGHGADMEALLSEWQSRSLEAGIGTPSPRQITQMSPGCVDMKRAMLLHAVPPMEAAHELLHRFHSCEDEEQFHLSRHIPVCVSEA